ncbi:MAG: hypothetical protein BGN88_00605 [Clostridiales bacterium 43-6]|nr:MAG: hypothetical protein BGN88_00605 [Clostridiales bacterium 43-6]
MMTGCCLALLFTGCKTGTSSETSNIATAKSITTIKQSNTTIPSYKTTDITDIVFKKTGSMELTLDVLQPTRRKFSKNPVIVLIHGGAWVSGDKASDLDMLLPAINVMRSKGYAVVSTNYRLATSSVKFPLPVIDCADAVRWCVKNAAEYDFDTSKMGICGASAGGYLSLMAGLAPETFTEDNDLKGIGYELRYIIDVCGPAVLDINKTTVQSEYAKETLSYFMGGSPEKKPAAYQKANPMNYLNPSAPGLLIIHGKDDNTVPFEQSQLLYNEAQKMKMDARLIGVNNAGHSFEPSGNTPVEPSLLEIFSTISDFIESKSK